MSRATEPSALLAGALIALTACSTQQTAPASPPPQTTQPAPQATAAGAPVTAAPAPAAVAPAAGPAVIASAQFAGNPDLRCDLLEVKRISGGALRAQWRIVNPSSKPIHYDFSWSDIYYIDPAENKKYGFLTDAEGNRIIDVFYGTLPPGEQRLNWAKFPAPPATSTRVSVNVPKFAPFEDVPVTP